MQSLCDPVVNRFLRYKYFEIRSTLLCYQFVRESRVKTPRAVWHTESHNLPIKETRVIKKCFNKEDAKKKVKNRVRATKERNVTVARKTCAWFNCALESSNYVITLRIEYTKFSCVSTRYVCVYTYVIYNNYTYYVRLTTLKCIWYDFFRSASLLSVISKDCPLIFR